MSEKGTHCCSRSAEEEWLALKSIAKRLLKNAVSEKKAWKRKVESLKTILSLCDKMASADGTDAPEKIDGALYEQAFELVCAHQNASIAWLHRRLRVSYRTATQLIEELERDNVVGPPNHVGFRDVLRDPLGRQI